MSGISKEDFRLIDTIENEYDATTAAALDAVQRRGEMVVRILDPRIHLTKTASDAAKKFLMLQVNHKCTIIHKVLYVNAYFYNNSTGCQSYCKSC